MKPRQFKFNGLMVKMLRNHMKLPDGGYRDTVVFSIIESEWPAVKRNLQFLLETGGQR